MDLFSPKILGAPSLLDGGYRPAHPLCSGTECGWKQWRAQCREAAANTIGHNSNLLCPRITSPTLWFSSCRRPFECQGRELVELDFADVVLVVDRGGFPDGGLGVVLEPSLRPLACRELAAFVFLQP